MLFNPETMHYGGQLLNKWQESFPYTITRGDFDMWQSFLLNIQLQDDALLMLPLFLEWQLLQLNEKFSMELSLITSLKLAIMHLIRGDATSAGEKW